MRWPEDFLAVRPRQKISGGNSYQIIVVPCFEVGDVFAWPQLREYPDGDRYSATGLMGNPSPCSWHDDIVGFGYSASSKQLWAEAAMRLVSMCICYYQQSATVLFMASGAKLCISSGYARSLLL